LTTERATTNFSTVCKTSRTIKSGTRALGIAFSDSQSTSTCAGAVVRADRVVDGFAFSQCTVGGDSEERSSSGNPQSDDDATDAVCRLVAELDRPDITALLLAGVAPAWFNVLDLRRIHVETGLPTLSISFERSDGLAPAIREAFDGEARRWRIERYEALPPRYALSLDDERVFVRAVGAETGVEEAADRGDGSPPSLAPNAEAARIVRGHTPEGGRPEPLRVARLAARAGREYAEE
jgi:endonuclease V-like protein UPF0215 family